MPIIIVVIIALIGCSEAPPVASGPQGFVGQEQSQCIVLSDDGNTTVIEIRHLTDTAPQEDVLPGDDPFNIQLRFFDSISHTDAWIVREMAAKWEGIITEGHYDLDFANYNNHWYSEALLRTIDVYGVIDDLVVVVDARRLDGDYKGIADVFIKRQDTHVPLACGMVLDSGFLSTASVQQKKNVIMHELAHCLGFGNAWIWSPLFLMQSGNEGPIFKGKNAIREYGSEVPMDELGQHWHPEKLRGELMTSGWGGTNQPVALSIITLGALMDTGYQVDMSKADPYTVPE